MTTHILSMTYQPKIEGVRNGTIRQTIRKYNEKRPFKVGDKLLIHGWEGRPYRSHWSWRIDRFTIRQIGEFDAREWQVVDRNSVATRGFGWIGYGWDTPTINHLAEQDGISPPTGQALKETLEKYHGKFTDDPVRFQVIRW